jgi:2-desacetyl-2-hydroxyethyl bacteriochlorophyllide A dehydrogenase
VKAKVWHLVAPGKLELREEPLPEILATEVLCKTVSSVISTGTEIAAYQGLPPLRPGKVYPRVQGYCNLAEIQACGDKVEGYCVGDRVLTFESHRSHFVMDQSAILCLVARTTEPAEAAATYLFHLGYDACLKSELSLGSPIVVIGLGILGITTSLVARAAGAKVYTLSDQNLPASIVVSKGAKNFRRSQREELIASLGDRLADCVITTTNQWSDWDVALDLAGRNSMIATLGFPGRGEPPPEFNPLDSSRFYMKQLRLQAVGLAPEENDSRDFIKFNEKTNMAFLLDQVESGLLDAGSLITGTLSFDDLDTAYQKIIARENSALTFALRWQ